ncbi:hypothetical protein AB4090_13990 [Acidithiobacillus sp. IBUN Pt1247-S3]
MDEALAAQTELTLFTAGFYGISFLLGGAGDAAAGQRSCLFGSPADIAPGLDADRRRPFSGRSADDPL